MSGGAATPRPEPGARAAVGPHGGVHGVAHGASAGAGSGAPALTILLVEDNPGDAELLRLLLIDDGDVAAAGLAGTGRADERPVARPPEVLWVERVAAAREVVAAREQAGLALDVILLDLSLPDARGLDTLAQVRAAAPSLPIVVLTGLDDEAVALQALQAGAQDYLVKGAVTGTAVRRAVRHAMERQRLLLEAQRATRARDMVLGVVAHDLRNPISTIKMCAAALDGAAAPDQVASMRGVIQRSAEWMEHIIRDLLDVTRIEAGRLAVELGEVPVREVLRRARELHAPLADDRGVRFDVQLAGAALDAAPAAAPVLLADADRVLQAIGNLVGNAIKFTPAGGRVTLHATPRTDVPMVRVAVTDTGPGIAPEHLAHVFDRFWQARETRRAGAGLGLAIVKGIVEAHGGVLGVESTVGAGTTFWFDLPNG